MTRGPLSASALAIAADRCDVPVPHGPQGAVVAGKYSEHNSGENEHEIIENAFRIPASSTPEKGSQENQCVTALSVTRGRPRSPRPGPTPVVRQPGTTTDS